MNSTPVEILAFWTIHSIHFSISSKDLKCFVTNYSEWLETNDNEMALCPMNVAGEVRLPNSCSVYIFSRVLVHVDEHCHGAKLVCHDV